MLFTVKTSIISLGDETFEFIHTLNKKDFGFFIKYWITPCTVHKLYSLETAITYGLH